MERAGPMKLARARGSALATCPALWILLAAVAAHGSAQEPDSVVLRIRAEATDDSQLEPLARALLDSLGPRLTASPGMERAQDWAVATLRGWGLEARTERYGTWEGWERGVSHIDLLEPRVRSLEGRLLAWSPGTGGGAVEGPVTIPPSIRSPDEWRAFLGTVRGRWVMMSFAEPTCRPDEEWREFAPDSSYQRMAADREAARALWEYGLRAAGSRDPRHRDLDRDLERAGALGVVTSEWSGAYGTTRVYDALNRGTPTFELSCEDYGLVHRLAERGSDPLVRLTADARSLGEVPVFNVVGTIPGTQRPDEYVVLSAHLDSWDGGSGATDNGAGVLVMMEAARILARVLPHPRRTILVGLWSGEEQGLVGSRAFTEDHPEVLAGLQALFNQDNGTGRIVDVSPQGFTDGASALAAWLSRVPAEVTRGLDLERPGTPGSGSDYASFVCWGAPAFAVGGASWDYGTHTWHTGRDTYDKLVFDDLRNDVVLVASLAYLASEDTHRVGRAHADVVVGPGGRARPWPACAPAARSSGGGR